MRAEGHAVESICRVLREQGCQIAARTYRSWRQPDRAVAQRTITDAMIVDKVRDIAWTLDQQGRRRLTPEGLYGRRKMTALVRRSLPEASAVMTPLRMALWQRDHDGHPVTRQSGQALIHHCDAGSQYTSIKLTEHLELEGIRPSIGSVADAYDNALMETVNGLYKTECIRTTVFHDGPYKTLADVEYATAGWVDWYNQRRLHSSLGYLTPTEYETVHYATLTREPQPI